MSGFDLSTSPEPEDWISLGSRQGRCCLAMDAPGFTVCFDACMDAHRRELCAVRVMRHAPRSVSSDEVPSSGIENVVISEDTRAKQDECCFEVGSEALPTLAHSAHGAWLRSPDSRPQGTAAQAWSTVLAPGAIEALREDALALVRRHGCGGKTYWQDATMPARCLLEHAALEVLQFHAAAAPDEFTGAEWWVQLRNAPPMAAACKGDSMTSLAEEADREDASSIAFHFDCDEGLYSATRELVPPLLSTVTYLTGAGAPTLVLPARAGPTGDAVPTATGAFLSFPHAGKHLCFDGTLLHGCPHALATEVCAELALGHSPTQMSEDVVPPCDAKASLTCNVRLTLLVNLWQRHRPAGPRPLPKRVAESLSGVDIEAPAAASGTSRTAKPRLDLLLLPRASAPVGNVITVDPGAGCSERCFAPSDMRRALSPAAQTAHTTCFPTAAALVNALAVSHGSTGAEGLLHAPAVQLAGF